jgi:membrane dipeptidase
VRSTLISIVALIACLLAAGCPADECVDQNDVRGLHEHLVVLDTHLDTPIHFARKHWSIMDRHSVTTDLSQVDYPRMLDGGLDGGFWVIFTTQGPLTSQDYVTARTHALMRAVQIREMVASNASHFALALNPDDAKRIVASGRRVVYQSIENSYPLGQDVTLLETFYALGVRLVGPVHSENNQFADSATDSHGARWHGLSPLGRRLVEEANRLGMVLDASHASDDTFDQMLKLSKTPIILSHSGLKAILNHPRNIDDGRLRQLAASGGVIQVTAVSAFLVDTPVIPEIEAAFDKTDRLEDLTSPQIAELAAALRDLNKKYHIPEARFGDFIRELFHAIEVAGVDHVGIGADWDGGGGIEGFDDVSKLPKVTVALRKAGYSEDDIAKIMGGNVLRVLQQAQDYAHAQQTRESPPAAGACSKIRQLVPHVRQSRNVAIGRVAKLMRTGHIRSGLAVSDDALGLQELMNTPIGVFAPIA